MSNNIKSNKSICEKCLRDSLMEWNSDKKSVEKYISIFNFDKCFKTTSSDNCLNGYIPDDTCEYKLEHIMANELK